MNARDAKDICNNSDYPGIWCNNDQSVDPLDEAIGQMLPGK